MGSVGDGDQMGWDEWGISGGWGQDGVGSVGNGARNRAGKVCQCRSVVWAWMAGRVARWVHRCVRVWGGGGGGKCVHVILTWSVISNTVGRQCVYKAHREREPNTTIPLQYVCEGQYLRDRCYYTVHHTV